MAKKVVILALTERGNRVGESHHNCRIPQAVVDHIRDLHEDEGFSGKQLAEMFKLSLPTVKKLLLYQRRACIPFRFKRVVIEDEKDFSD